jgi:hypothetical protein
MSFRMPAELGTIRENMIEKINTETNAVLNADRRMIFSPLFVVNTSEEHVMPALQQARVGNIFFQSSTVLG